MVKFVIDRGMDNEYIITIKANGSTLGMQIEPTDTFEVRLYRKCSDELVATIDMTEDNNGVVDVYQAPGGKIRILLKQALVDTLDTSKGEKVDGCYPRSEYRLSVICNTANNGKFTAKLANVFVE